MASRNRNLGTATIILVNNRPGVRVPLDDGNLKHATSARAEWQKRTVGCAAIGTECGQYDVTHLLVVAKHGQKRRIEPAAAIAFSRAQEFVAEAKAVEKDLEPCIVVLAKTAMLPKWIGNRRERLAQMALEHVLVGNVVGDLAQPIHIVRESDEPGGNVR